METSLIDRYLRRACDYSGKPYTTHRLAQRCEMDISREGPEAFTSVQLQGKQGRGHKKHRRLFPTAPLGKILYVCTGLLNIDFPSAELLAALRGRHAAFAALANHYIERSEHPYPLRIPPQLAIQFAQDHLRVEIDPEVIEAIAQSTAIGASSDTRHFIVHLLELELHARRQRWKRVDLARWRATGFLRPRVPTPFVGPPKPKPKGTVYRVTERHAELLRLFDRADEAAKQHIVQFANFAAEARPLVQLRPAGQHDQAHMPDPLPETR